MHGCRQNTRNAGASQSPGPRSAPWVGVELGSYPVGVASTQRELKMP